jgi:hypothetical protein
MPGLAAMIEVRLTRYEREMEARVSPARTAWVAGREAVDGEAPAEDSERAGC